MPVPDRPLLITDHKWRPKTKYNNNHCAYMNCRKPREAHAEVVAGRPDFWKD